MYVVEMTKINLPITEIKYFGVNFPKDLVEQVDKIRGDIPRSKFLLRLVEKKIRESQI